jgi:ribosomal protein S18 acetylase RimI-like enzyme
MVPLNGNARPESREGTLYYIHVPTAPRPVRHAVEFLPVTAFLEDEAACKALWDMLHVTFKTRSKFLSIWPAVRFVALHRRGGELVGALLVSAAVNWQVDYVIVRPDHRGQGIAESLVNEAVNQALARQVPYVMLTSREGLRPLYEGACGFTVVGRAPQTDLAPTFPATLPHNLTAPLGLQI